MHLTESQKHSSELISQYFKGKEQIVTEALSFDHLKAECERLNLLESFIPGGALDLHYNMILNKTVTDYYKKMANGGSALLEGVSKPRLKKTLDALEKFQSTINEKNASDFLTNDLASLKSDLLGLGSLGGSIKSKATGALSKEAPTTLPKSEKEAEEVIQSAVGTEDKTGQHASLLKGLWNTFTEGGSVLGVLHLLLDFVGLFGDIIYPLGAAADLLNSAIYFTRAAFDHNKEKKGELLFLGGISLIAALIPFGGDALKLGKHAVKPMAKVTVATMRGSKSGIATLSKVPKAQRSVVIKTLRFMAKHAATAFAKASKLFTKLFAGITKMVGVVPFIGKPLQNVFTKFGKILTKASDNMLKFADNFKSVEKGIVKAEVKAAMESIDKVIKGGGYLKYSKSGKKIKAIAEGGEVLATFPAKYLTSPKIWNKKFPGLFKLTGEISEDVVGFMNFQGKGTSKLMADSASKLYKALAKKGALAKKTTGWLTTKFMPFVIKQFAKAVQHSDQIVVPEMTEGEVSAIGNVEFNNYIAKEMEKKREETGAIDVRSVMLDSRDEKAHEMVTDYLNGVAKKHGYPSIAEKAFEETPIEKVDAEFQSMWTQMANGELEFNDEGNLIKADESLFFIKSREDFLKS